jgi:hypothetical protein
MLFLIFAMQIAQEAALPEFFVLPKHADAVEGCRHDAKQEEYNEELRKYSKI